jgi:DNA primase
MIPDRILEDIRARADIVEIIGESIQLKRSGKDFKALCPFHTEKTPSFYVVPSKGIYTCFGCHASGDVFKFLMERTGATFPEAVRIVAARVGIEVPEDTREGGAEEPHRALYEAMAFAADHYVEALRDDAGASARQYLENRGIGPDAIDRFGIGYAPDTWRGLREAAHRHGIEDEVLRGAGLIKDSERSEEPYDRFRDRVIFPIAELSGRVVAFGGRVMRPAENAPKYLNSPETPIYHKSQLLYGLNWSKSAIRREGAVLVVEGYMDYVSLAARGIDNVAAGMGTSLTVEQANLIARYTAKAYLLYDSDTAGLKATFRTADALLRSGVHPLVVTLPPGEDPDSLVRQRGADALRERIDHATDVVEKKLQMLEERGFFSDIDGQRRALDRLLPTIRATIDPALRDIYIARSAERTGVRRETLEHEIESGDGSGSGRWRPARPRPDRAPGRPSSMSPAVSSQTSPGAAPAERYLLLLLLRDPTRIEQARVRVSADDLRDPANRELFESLLAGHGQTPSGLSAAATLRRAELDRDPTEVEDADHTFEDVVAEIREVRSLFERVDALKKRMEHALDDAEREHILSERHDLGRELRDRGVMAELGWKVSPRYRRFTRDPGAGHGETPTDER